MKETERGGKTQSPDTRQTERSEEGDKEGEEMKIGRMEKEMGEKQVKLVAKKNKRK